jgi:lipopolysaccharide export system protein LptC
MGGMGVSPLPTSKPPPRGPRQATLRSFRDGPRLARTVRPRRRWLVALAKRLLPAIALGLLLLVAFWPEINGNGDRSRISYRRVDVTAEGGQLTQAHYQGADASGRPYTVTASRVRQVGPDRTDLEAPKADMQMQSGEWLMVEAQRGVYEQKSNRLDLAGDVTLYRDDGTTLQTAAASLDLRANAAAGNEMVHAEGPFGVLDEQGFAVLDRGAVIQFTGPARIVLNGASR